ncbi:MAG: hypothetical protein AAF741_03855 [Bacteroidota bacterium]
MQATCKSCNHWDTNTTAVSQFDNFGECGVLSESGVQFVLPVLQDQSAPTGTEFITQADFGCNQYDGVTV